MFVTDIEINLYLTYFPRKCMSIIFCMIWKVNNIPECSNTFKLFILMYFVYKGHNQQVMDFFLLKNFVVF